MMRERIQLNGHDESYIPSRDLGRVRSGSNGRPEFRVPAPGRDQISIPAIDLEGKDETQFLRTEKRIPVRRGAIAKKTANRLKTFVLLTVVITLSGCLAWVGYDYGTQAREFRIDSSDNIEISGVRNASRDQVTEVFGDDISRNVFRVALEERKKKLEQIPWVESATVMRLLPNRLAISITERTPVAFVLTGSKTALIDASGVIMGPPVTRHTIYKFPVIRGITETEALSSRAAAMKLYNRLMRDLDAADSANRHFTRQLSEVDLTDPQDVRAMVSDASGTVLIHLGSSDFLERYERYATHIAEWRRQYHNVHSVDLRYEGQIVVNPDGERATQPEPPAVNSGMAAQSGTDHARRRSTRHKKRKKPRGSVSTKLAEQ